MGSECKYLYLQIKSQQGYIHHNINRGYLNYLISFPFSVSVVPIFYTLIKLCNESSNIFNYPKEPFLSACFNISLQKWSCINNNDKVF